MIKLKVTFILLAIITLSDCKKLEIEPSPISSLDCTSYQISSPVVSGVSVSGNSITIPYTGGNGGKYGAVSSNSTGVTGLTADLNAGNFTIGNGVVVYSLTGIPSSFGNAVFTLSLGGQSCILTIPVNWNSGEACSAKISPTETKTFMCHNLGSANVSADPFNPSWEIMGGYWQWGRKNMAAPGPTEGDPNAYSIGGWNTTYAENGSWADGSKTVNDPCPTGYRVPTKAQWDAVFSNNTLTHVGTWDGSNTNYSVGKMIGNKLFLPAAGGRHNGEGGLFGRSLFGGYWSSTEDDSNLAWYLYFNGGYASTTHNSYYRNNGLSVRCIAE